MATMIWSQKYGKAIHYGFVLGDDLYEWNEYEEAYANESDRYDLYTLEQANEMIQSNKAHWV